jgi:hypothetical protein
MDKLVAQGPDIPRVNLGGSDWAEMEIWLKEKREETYRKLAKETASWEETLILRGQASFIEKMLDFRQIAGPLTRV